jgi:Beta-ketoacyl synthase, N-terminal domain
VHPFHVMSFDQWKVPVAKWVAWRCDPAESLDTPDLQFIEPMQRRRLSPLARAALHAANACSSDQSAVSMVYASRHGELARTMESLFNLARREPLSPTTFSLSVLNSAPGLFSIARAESAASTAVSAGCETFGFGLLEAAARATIEPALPVLYVYADTEAPAPVGRQHGDPTGPVALAILIEASADRTLHISTKISENQCSEAPQAFACFAALNGTAASWHSGRRQWDIRLQ